jgi:hypothetical protein
MLDVDKNYLDSSYIDSYWKNNLIIDQSKTKINENRNLNLEDDIKKEKLNKIIKNKSSYDINDNTEKKYNNFKYTDTIRSNNTGTNNKYYIREECSRKQDSNFRITNKQKSSEYRTFQKYSDTSENKREMHNLSEKCRIYEYNLRERKVLLDSFSKPKLIKN